MSASTDPVGEESGPPDLLFSLVGGLYAAAMAGPLGVAVARRIVAGAGPLYLTYLATGLAAVVAGTLGVRRLDGIAVRLGNTPLVWLLSAVPLAAMGAVLAVGASVGGLLTATDTLLALVGGFGGTFVGFVLASMAKTRYTAAVVEHATVAVEWAAPWPERLRHRITSVAGTVLVVGVVGLVVGILLDWPGVRLVGQILFPVGAVLATVGRERTYRVTDRGLEIRVEVARRYLPWRAIAGYRLNAESLVLVRPEPYRQSLRCDVAAIDDFDAVREALDVHLERLS